MTVVELAPTATGLTPLRGGVAALPAGRAGGARARPARRRPAPPVRRGDVVRGSRPLRAGERRRSIVGRPSLAESADAVVEAAAAAARGPPDGAVPAGAAPRQRARRARHGPGAGLLPGPGGARRRARPGSPALGRGARRAPGSTPTGILAGRRRRPHRRAGAARRRPARRTSPTASSPRARWPAPRTRDRRRHVPQRRRSRRPTSCSPAAGFAEKRGTTTNLEGRVSLLAPEGHRRRARPAPTG